MDRDQKKPGNYLIFDGGRSALSALYIIEEICSRLQFDLDLDEEVRVCDHCDLLGGSGNGAVAAILLGRMGYTPSQAIKAYLKLEPTLSVQPTKDKEERQRNSDAFKAAFTKVLVEAGFTADTPMMDKSAPKTVVWTLSAANLSIPQPIRSYRVRSSPGPACTILEAACASIASPDKFLPVTLGPDHKQVVLIDAMSGYANPTKELLKEAQDLFGDEAEVASVVSLGAGKGGLVSITRAVNEDALTDALRRMIIDSEQTHEEIYGRLNQLSIYLRFNVERGLEQQVDTSSVYECTTAYMKEGDINKLLDNAVKSISSRQRRGTLKDINSVTAVETTMKPRPSLVDNFVGREDILDALRTTHFNSRPSELHKPAISVLTGLGGSGKTQTALKFALEYEGRYRDASVYFFNASSEDKLKADFELAIRARDPASHSKSHDDAFVWFTNRADDWFIIMDNADDPLLDLFHFIPKSSHGNVIITSRNATYKKFAPTNSHHVEGLSPTDASMLILKGSSYPDNLSNRTYALLISKELGYLPLALAHAAAYISDHQCLSTYLNTYRERRAGFLASKPALPEDYSLSVGTTLQMSLDSISPRARDMIALLSRLDPAFIAYTIIETSAKRSFCQVDGRSEDEASSSQTTEQAKILMAILCPSGGWLECDFNDIVRECLQYSLLHIATQGEARFYSMHVLVQAYLQSISTTIREHRPNHLIVRLLGSSITIDFNYKHHAFNRLLASHLRLVSVDDVVEAGDHFGFGHVLREQGNARLSTEHYERCFELRRSGLGDENKSTVSAMHELAVCYNLAGRYQEALDLGVKDLDAKKRISGDEHPDTLLTMNNLAASYHFLGRHQEASELRVKVLDLRKRISGDEHLETLRAMGELAVSYHAQGKYEDGVELEIKVLDLRKRISGDEHPDTLIAMDNLASTYRQLRRYEEALELQEKVMEMFKRILGEEHPDTLVSMWNLSATLHESGSKEQAVSLLQAAVPLQEKAVGMDHPNTIRMKEWLDSFLKPSL